MEPLRKCPRVSQVIDRDDLNPDFDLQESRARNDLRLKSTFEAIFSKYEHDFTGIGDEIDLQTGEIVVNNGHIMDMRSEHDIGNGKTRPSQDLRASTTAIGEKSRPRDTSSLLSDDFDRLSNRGHEEVKLRADAGVQSDDDDLDSLLGSEQDTNVPAEQNLQMKDMWDIGEDVRDTKAQNDGALFRGRPSQQAIISQFGPMLGLQIAQLVSNVGDTNDAPVEEAWCVPDLPGAPPTQRPIFKSLINMRRERSVSPLDQRSIWALPRSLGRQKKDRHVDIGKRTLTGNISLAAEPEALVPDKRQVNPRNNNQDKVVLGYGSNGPRSKRKLHDLPSCHLPSPQEDGSDLETIEQSNAVDHHQIQCQPVNRKASYTTPKSSPLDNPKKLQNSQGSPLKRKRLQQSKHTTEALSQNPKKQDLEHQIIPGQITTHHCTAELQELLAPRSNPSPLLKREQLTYCARWTLQEEELLRHLKENTDLAYAQLVEYFPGRTKGNIKAHYFRITASTKPKSRNSEMPPRPPYTPQEDELLLELRSNKGLPWKDIRTSFPTRTLNSLTQRYSKVMQITPPRPKQTTSAESTSATSEDLLHIDSMENSLGVTSSEQKVLEDPMNAELLKGDIVTQFSSEPTEAGSRALCEATDKGQPLLVSRLIEKTPLGDRTRKLDSPFSAAFKVVIESSSSRQRQHIAHGDGVTTAMATPDSDDRLQCPSKDISAERTSSLIGDISPRAKFSHKKTSQSRTSKSTPTASRNHKVTKSRLLQGAGTKASPKTLTPQSKAALVSLLGDVTDDEDELSKSDITIGISKDRPPTTPNRAVGQGCMGGKSCDRKFCFKCM